MESDRNKNICPLCKGKKVFNLSNNRTSNCCCEDGTYIGYLESEITIKEQSTKHLAEKYQELQDWAKEKSNCSKCGGDQKKTLALLKCDECGIPGTGYWPG